jgi:hypothetical protein
MGPQQEIAFGRFMTREDPQRERMTHGGLAVDLRLRAPSGLTRAESAGRRSGWRGRMAWRHPAAIEARICLREPSGCLHLRVVRFHVEHRGPPPRDHSHLTHNGRVPRRDGDHGGTSGPARGIISRRLSAERRVPRPGVAPDGLERFSEEQLPPPSDRRKGDRAGVDPV